MIRVNKQFQYCPSVVNPGIRTVIAQVYDTITHNIQVHLDNGRVYYISPVDKDKFPPGSRVHEFYNIYGGDVHAPGITLVNNSKTREIKKKSRLKLKVK